MQSLAAGVGAGPSPWFKRPLYAPLKYPAQALRTWRLLTARDPAEVWVMGPPASAMLTSLAVLPAPGPPARGRHAHGRFLRPQVASTPLRGDAGAPRSGQQRGHQRRAGCPRPRVGLLGGDPHRPSARAARSLGSRAGARHGHDHRHVSEDEPIGLLLPQVASALRDVRFFVTGRPRLETTT